MLKRFRPNAYVIDILPNYGISSTFYMEDLVAHKGPIVIPNNPSYAIANLILDLAPLVPQHKNNLLRIFWMRRWFSSMMEVFNISWCIGEDNQSQTVLPELLGASLDRVEFLLSESRW